MKKLVCTLLLVSACVVSTLFADIIFSENFEGNADDNWYVDNGTWQVGAPISGPGYAYQGTSCLATILAGNYPPTVLTKSISVAQITIPPASQFPRLTFWEWFDFNLHADFRDHGKVLIKPIGSTEWMQLGSNKIMNSSGIWCYTAYDVSMYAGQTVQIAFELDVANTYTVYMGDPPDEGLGWYIDDVEIKTGTPVFNCPENWESGIGDWYVDNGTWEVGAPTSGPGAAYGGTGNCLATKLSGYYYPDALSKVISPEYSVPLSSQYPRLTFWEWFSFHLSSNYRDHGRVLIRVSGTTEWTQLGVNKIKNSSSVWSYTSYDLTAFSGQAVQFAFELDVANTDWSPWNEDYADEASGWFIDNLQIKTGTPVFNNPETWESGIGDWYVDNGTWEVGTPTSGPGAAYGGTGYCLATKLSGYYYPDALSKVISPEYSVPLSSQYPRLTFWEWFSFHLSSNYRDHGRVLIRVSGTTEWLPLGVNKINISSLVWSYTSYDITAFSGQTVQFAFEIDVANTDWGPWGEDYADEASGWFIDNLQIKTGVPVFNNPETWESGIGNWYVTNGTWEIGTPTSGPNAAYQGTKCAATKLSGNYYNWNETRLISPAYQIPADATGLALRYRHWFNTATGDTLFTQIKTEAETTWHTLSGGTFTGNGGGVWSYTYIPMQSYAGQTVNIAFYLDSDGGSAPGWYIDNVLVSYTTATPPNPSASAATNITQTSFQANWNASTGATSYRLDVSVDSGFSSFVAGYNDLTVSGLSQIVTGLDAGTMYYYRVRAASASGTSGNSNTISVLTIAPNPVATSASNITAISFQANWDASVSATSYRLDVSTNEGFASYVSGFNNMTVTETHQSVIGLTPGTYYYYRVRAVNASGTSGNSNVITVRTPPAPPLPPQNVNIELSGNNIVLSWDAVTQSIVNTPIIPDYYLVFSSVDPYAEFGYLGAVTGLEYTHLLAAIFGQRMFYEVFAYKYYDRDIPVLPALANGMSKEEVFRLLSTE